MKPLALILLVSLFFVMPVSAGSLALGVNVGGGQIRWDFSPFWGAEARYLRGSVDNGVNGQVSSEVMGARILRRLSLFHRARPYGGLELALVKTKEEGGPKSETSGTALGAFGGLEIPFARRFAVGLDMGPYYLHAKVKNDSIADNSWEFVVNSYVNFYFFPLSWKEGTP